MHHLLSPGANIQRPNLALAMHAFLLPSLTPAPPSELPNMSALLLDSHIHAPAPRAALPFGSGLLPLVSRFGFGAEEPRPLLAQDGFRTLMQFSQDLLLVVAWVGRLLSLEQYIFVDSFLDSIGEEVMVYMRSQLQNKVGRGGFNNLDSMMGFAQPRPRLVEAMGSQRAGLAMSGGVPGMSGMPGSVAKMSALHTVQTRLELERGRAEAERGEGRLGAVSPWKSPEVRSEASPNRASMPVEIASEALLKDIPAWLRVLRLHKYSDKLKDVPWRELVEYDDARLEQAGVSALGARRKLLKAFEYVKSVGQ